MTHRIDNKPHTLLAIPEITPVEAASSPSESLHGSDVGLQPTSNSSAQAVATNSQALAEPKLKSWFAKKVRSPRVESHLRSWMPCSPHDEGRMLQEEAKRENEHRANLIRHAVDAKDLKCRTDITFRALKRRPKASDVREWVGKQYIEEVFIPGLRGLVHEKVDAKLAMAECSTKVLDVQVRPHHGAWAASWRAVTHTPSRILHERVRSADAAAIASLLADGHVRTALRCLLVAQPAERDITTAVSLILKDDVRLSCNDVSDFVRLVAEAILGHRVSTPENEVGLIQFAAHLVAHTLGNASDEEHAAMLVKIAKRYYKIMGAGIVEIKSRPKMEGLIAGIIEAGECLYDQAAAEANQRRQERVSALAGVLLSPLGGIPLAGAFVVQAVTEIVKLGLSEMWAGHTTRKSLTLAHKVTDYVDLTSGKSTRHQDLKEWRETVAALVQ